MLMNLFCGERQTVKQTSSDVNLMMFALHSSTWTNKCILSIFQAERDGKVMGRNVMGGNARIVRSVVILEWI